MVGENALFHSNGSGLVIQWTADGVYVTKTDPVTVCIKKSSGTGIGQVVNVRFTPSFAYVLCDPPATAGVLNGLLYRYSDCDEQQHWSNDCQL